MNSRNTTNIDFMFENMPVGCFVMDMPPRCEGIFSYMPYRGHGNYEMQQALENLGSAVCSYSTGSELVTFTVVACPEYGKLRLTNFKISPK